MSQRFRHQIVIALGHRCLSWSPASLLLCLLAWGGACKVHAQEPSAAGNPVDSGADVSAAAGVPDGCLPSGGGYMRARLSGAVRAELVWGNEGTECTGAVRPTDGGIRMRFSRGLEQQPGKLILVFGIAGLREGANARTLPVNVTVIREGAGEFYSTQGDDKCMLDEVTQEPLIGIPHRTRTYRIVARGFCTEPARAVRGKGAVLLSRFDFAGRVDFESEADEDELAGEETTTLAGSSSAAARSPDAAAQRALTGSPSN
jgi:hypothetical protein